METAQVRVCFNDPHTDLIAISFYCLSEGGVIRFLLGELMCFYFHFNMSHPFLSICLLGKCFRLGREALSSYSGLPSSISLCNCSHISSSLEHNWSKCIPVVGERE